MRDDFLAAAVFASNKDVGVGRADARDGVEHRLHGCGLGDEFRTALRLEEAILGRQTLRLLKRAMQFDLRAQNGEQAFVLPGLLNEVARAAPHRFDRQLDVAPRGHDDDRQIAVERHNLRKQIEAFLAGRGVARVVEIDQQRVIGIQVQRLADLRGRSGLLDAIALGIEAGTRARREYAADRRPPECAARNSRAIREDAGERNLAAWPRSACALLETTR